jgi:hypothetical protein
MSDSGAITIGEFAARIEALISDAREEGLSDEAIIAGLEQAATALKEGVSSARGFVVAPGAVSNRILRPPTF